MPTVAIPAPAVTTESVSTPVATATDGVETLTGGVLRVTTEATPAVAPAAERPAYLPEGIESPEKLAEAYKALKDAQPAPVPTPLPDKVIITTPAEAEAAAKKAGVDLDALSAEYMKDGKLSEASLKALEDKGISRGVADNYIAGQKAQADQFVSNLATHVGGADQLQCLLDFGVNLSAAEQEVINAGFQTSEVAAKFSLDVLKARYEAANGTLATSPIVGEVRPTTSGPQPYLSIQEQSADMRDPRYKVDPAFRDAVARRSFVSNL